MPGSRRKLKPRHFRGHKNWHWGPTTHEEAIAENACANNEGTGHRASAGLLCVPLRARSPELVPDSCQDPVQVQLGKDFGGFAKHALFLSPSQVLWFTQYYREVPQLAGR